VVSATSELRVRIFLVLLPIIVSWRGNLYEHFEFMVTASDGVLWPILCRANWPSRSKLNCGYFSRCRSGCDGTASSVSRRAPPARGSHVSGQREWLTDVRPRHSQPSVTTAREACGSSNIQSAVRRNSINRAAPESFKSKVRNVLT